MSLCPKEKCPHWGKATKYERKCYYDFQCWRGQLDGVLFLMGFLFFYPRRGKNETNKK